MINRNYLRAFYGVVLAIALAGAGLAAADWLDWWLPVAFIAVAAVELGGVTLSVHADTRRQLGERAVAARVLSAAVAVGAVAVNYFGHQDQLGQAIFFAGMSALGYTTWLIDSGGRRRDRLRSDGKLPPTPPVYGLVQWLRHPWLTRRARRLALIDPSLGLYGSLAAAEAAVRAERRRAAIAAELRTMIAAAAGPKMATVAVNTYDMDQVAQRLADSADYDGLAGVLAGQLTPAALTAPVSAASARSFPRVESPRTDLDVEVSGAGQVSNPGQVSDPVHVQLSSPGQFDRGEDSRREVTGSGQAELSHGGTVERDESITGPTGQEIVDGDLFELAASLDRPHYPLPREQARAANGHGDSLSLAGLFAGGTRPETPTATTPDARPNGAHVTAFPPVPLALTERPEAATDGGQIDRLNGRHVDTELAAEAASNGGQDGGQNAAAVATEPPDTGRPDDADLTGSEAVTRAPKKLSANERKIAQAVNRTPDATIAEIAKRLKVSERTVRRARAKLRAQSDTSGVAS